MLLVSTPSTAVGLLFAALRASLSALFLAVVCGTSFLGLSSFFVPLPFFPIFLPPLLLSLLLRRLSRAAGEKAGSRRLGRDVRYTVQRCGVWCRSSDGSVVSREGVYQVSRGGKRCATVTNVFKRNKVQGMYQDYL